MIYSEERDDVFHQSVAVSFYMNVSMSVPLKSALSV